jgi:UDP-glucose 4-epimerase
MKSHFVITGGAGFIGTNLAHHLVSQGYEVTVVDNLSAGDAKRLPPEVVFHQTDIRDTAALTTIFKAGDIVVHLAALPRVQFSMESPVETHDVNVNGTLSVLEAAKAAGVKRIVYAASSSAYGDQEQLPLTPDMPPQPKSPYALHKYVGEMYMKLWAELYDLETVSLRFFNVYGPYLDPDGPYALVIGRFLKLAREGKPLTITGDGTQTRDFTYVHDVVAAVVKAGTVAKVGNGEVLNVGAGKQTSLNELARMISDSIEYVAPRIEPKHTLADISKTTALLNWTPQVPIEEGIADLKKAYNLL